MSIPDTLPLKNNVSKTDTIRVKKLPVSVVIWFIAELFFRFFLNVSYQIKGDVRCLHQESAIMTNF